MPMGIVRALTNEEIGGVSLLNNERALPTTFLELMDLEQVAGDGFLVDR
jgi:hypothetical protein